jgi:hypothetical protein
MTEGKEKLNNNTKSGARKSKGLKIDSKGNN